MAVYVGFRETEEESVPARVASPSLTALRSRLRQYAGSQWRIGKTAFRWSIPTICQAIEDPLELPFDEDLGSFVVTASGRVQKKNGRG